MRTKWSSPWRIYRQLSRPVKTYVHTSYSFRHDCAMWRLPASFDEPSQYTSFGVSGFVRMELLRLTVAQSGPGQTRMSHWRCDILKQVALKRPSLRDVRFTLFSLSVSPSNSRCSQIFTPPGCMLFRFWFLLTPHTCRYGWLFLPQRGITCA